MHTTAVVEPDRERVEVVVVVVVVEEEESMVMKEKEYCQELRFFNQLFLVIPSQSIMLSH